MTARAEKRIQEGIAATSAKRLEAYLKVSRIVVASLLQSTVDRAHLQRICCQPKAMQSAKSYSESPRVQPKPFGFDLIKAPLP